MARPRPDVADRGPRFSLLHLVAVSDSEHELGCALSGDFSGHLFAKLFRCDSSGRARSCDLAPFVILLYRQGLYVVGSRIGEGFAAADLNDWRRGLGVFAMERFVEAEPVRKSAFEIPATFKIEDVLHGAFGVHVGDPANARRVVIEFSAEKAELVAGRIWHPTQELTPIEGGRLRLNFTCTNLVPVVSWVLRWGPHAKVVEPGELSASVLGELRQAVALYEPST